MWNIILPKNIIARYIKFFKAVSGIIIYKGRLELSAETIVKMVDWVDKNIKENITLEDMSYHFGYSSFYCSAKFHEHVGVTFKQYTARRRLNLAAIEIKNSRRRLLDIAMDYGFSSQEAFTRAFVDFFKCTPYQYRKQFSK